jgi:hypothetical protein
MAIIQTGTSKDDELIIQSDSTSVQACMGTNTVVFSGNYADYTLSQSDSFVSYVTQFMIGPTGGSISTYF